VDLAVVEGACGASLRGIARRIDHRCGAGVLAIEWAESIPGLAREQKSAILNGWIAICRLPVPIGEA